MRRMPEVMNLSLLNPCPVGVKGRCGTDVAVRSTFLVHRVDGAQGADDLKIHKLE